MTNIDSLRLVICYYPEHWPEALWTDEPRRMPLFFGAPPSSIRWRNSSGYTESLVTGLQCDS